MTLRALIYNPKKLPIFGTKKSRQLELEEVSAEALIAGAARLGANDQLAILLVTEGGQAEATERLVRSLRHKGYRGPLIVLSPQSQADDFVSYLYAGADDAHSTQISERELIARLDAITRRQHGILTDQVTLGELTFFLDGRHPEIGGQQIKLSAREFSILRHLVLNKDRVVTKSAIYDALYALCAMPPFDKIIEVYICRLRAKIARGSGNGVNYIETVPGRGYRLCVPQPQLA